MVVQQSNEMMALPEYLKRHSAEHLASEIVVEKEVEYFRITRCGRGVVTIWLRL